MSDLRKEAADAILSEIRGLAENRNPQGIEQLANAYAAVVTNYPDQRSEGANFMGG